MNTMIRTLFLSAATAAGVLGAAYAENSPATFQPLMVGGTPTPQAKGAWQSRGYGWILEVEDSGIAVYQVSQAGCSRDPRVANFLDQFAYRRADAPPNQLIIVSYPGENRYTFDRLPRLPASCNRSEWTPPQLFDHFAASYREQYAFFAQHGFDWEKRVRTHRALVTEETSPRVLFAIFSDMLDGLGDAHVGMNAAFRGQEVAFRTGRGSTLQRIDDLAVKTRQPVADLKARWLEAYYRGIRDTVLGGKYREGANGKFIWGRIGSDIGYVNVSAVEKYTDGPLADNIVLVNDLMNRILAEFDGVDAVILDVTNNSGGYDRLAREIVGHFAAERTLAYSKHPFGAQGVTPDVFYAEPSAGRRYTGPVYLLTSDVTVSGGEILTMTMRVLPNVTQVGTPTRGALSDRLTKVMPDGSDFSISNEIYLDPEGKLFEVVGIPPHRALEIFPADDMYAGHAKAVNTLVGQIRAGSAGRFSQKR